MNVPVNKSVGITPWLNFGTAEQWVPRLYGYTGLAALLTLVSLAAIPGHPTAVSRWFLLVCIALWVSARGLDRWQARVRARARDSSPAYSRELWSAAREQEFLDSFTMVDLAPPEIAAKAVGERIHQSFEEKIEGYRKRVEEDIARANTAIREGAAAWNAYLDTQAIGHWNGGKVTLTPEGADTLGSYDAVMAAYRGIGRAPCVNPAAVDTALALEIAQELDARLTDLRIRFDNNRAPEAWQAAASTLYDLFTTLGHTPAIVMNQHTLFPPPVAPLPERPGDICDDRR